MKEMSHLLHQGARKWNTKLETAKNTIQRKIFLWILSSFLHSLTPGSSCVTQRDIKSQSHPRLAAVMSLLTASTPTAISSGRCTIPSRSLPQGSEVQFAKRTARSKIHWTNKWVTITDHLDSCGAFDLVQRQYLHDIKPAAHYGMNPPPIGIGMSERIIT